MSLSSGDTCKNGHYISSDNDLYYKRTGKHVYTYCKTCAREYRRKQISGGLICYNRLTEVDVNQHLDLLIELENAMPWEKDGIRDRIKNLSKSSL